jgi:hypothetical protein
MIKKTDIPNDTVTYAKMQNAEGANVVLGNAGSAGDPVKELSASELAGIVDDELLIDEDDFASDSDTKAPTQQSTKAYVDNAVTSPDVVLVETQTASASSSITFTTLSTDYRTFKVVFDSVVPGTDNQILQIRTSTDGGSSYDSGASDYSYARFLAVTSSAATFSDTSASFIPMHGVGAGTGTGELLNGEMTLFNPSAAQYTHIKAESSLINKDGNPSWSSVGGARLSAADVDAIEFTFASGTIASGTFKLYGYK